jgi:hypothetical protein
VSAVYFLVPVAHVHGGKSIGEEMQMGAIANAVLKEWQ